MQNEITITTTPKQPSDKNALNDWYAAKSLAQGARTEKMIARVAAANPGANPSEELIACWFFGQSLLRGMFDTPEASVAHVNEFAERYSIQYRATAAKLLQRIPTEFTIVAI